MVLLIIILDNKYKDTAFYRNLDIPHTLFSNNPGELCNQIPNECPRERVFIRLILQNGWTANFAYFMQ